MNNIIGIIKKSIILGCMLIFATANGNIDWGNLSDYKDLTKDVPVLAFTSSDNTKNQCTIIMEIIKKVYTEYKKKNENFDKCKFAQELAKVFLTNAPTENGKYEFTPAEEQKIETVRRVFFNHIRKHFSKNNMSLSKDGKHSIILKRVRGKSVKLEDREITVILNNIISSNTLEFSTDNNVLQLRHLKPVAANVALSDGENNFVVYSIIGQPNKFIDFDDIKLPEEGKFYNKDGVSIEEVDYKTADYRTGKSTMFFQLHLCPLSLAARAFGEDQRVGYEGSAQGEGRYGTCFIKI